MLMAFVVLLKIDTLSAALPELSADNVHTGATLRGVANVRTHEVTAPPPTLIVPFWSVDCADRDGDPVPHEVIAGWVTVT